MNVLLIDVDSKIPNLALMKISAYHKKRGDQVGFNIGDPDRVYASIVFSKNKWKGNGIKSMYPDAIVNVGGSGFSLDNKLPNEIEHNMPDYDIYNLDYSMGFATRGCIRKCDFCFVPKKEGGIKINADIFEFWDQKHKHIMLLDNNILAIPDHFKNIANQLIENNLTVDFNQGLDIRLINNENANILSKLRVKPSLRFAFDDISYEKEVRRGIKILKTKDINHSNFYVLVGYNTTIKEDMKRLETLKDLDQRAYVMRYDKCRGKRIYNDLASWANQPQFFMKYPFEKYCELRHNHM